MITPQLILPIHSELVIDLFAGGGGASTGIEQAIGRHVDIAVNHDPQAISLHEANHPQTRHFVSDVFEVDPLAVTDGRPVGLLWASPDCKHFSKAKGGKPVSNKIRGLAWVVVKWAKLVKPRVICLENVEEFQTWGPLGDDGRPCPERKGTTFQRWKKQLENLGYVIEHRELRACDYGAPTIRKRLFLVARRDGQPIVWPEPTHGAPDSLPVRQKRLKPWRTAAECIDWSIPAPSIFERDRPLAEATCRRIAKGIMRYVMEAAEPFIVETPYGDRNSSHLQQSVANWGHARRGRARTAPVQGDRIRVGRARDGLGSRALSASTGSVRGARGIDPSTHALSGATLIQTGYGERPGQSPRVPGLDKPLGTVVAGQKHALVSAFLAKHYTGVVGSAQGASAGLVQAFMVKYYGTDQDPNLREPLHTVTTKDRFGLVTVKGERYAIVDIGLRMLTPRELYRAQGFPDTYRIDTGAAGEPITKTAQVRMCGNSVCPPLAKAIVQANYSEAQSWRQAA